MIDDGTVARGSYLIVESLDRLSRQNIDEALDQFQDILRAGVSIVTLMDGMIYSRSPETRSRRFMDLMRSMTIMERANEESETKAKRTRIARAKGRIRAAETGKPINTQGPAWTEYNHETGKFKAVDWKVDIVKDIFRWASAGMGHGSITRRLVDNGVKPIARGDHWHINTVRKFLQSRLVLGEWEPHTTDATTGKRVSAGEPIKIYPQIIDLEVWQQVQADRITKRGGGKGRKGRGYTNLFQGMTACGVCGRTFSVRQGKTRDLLWIRCERRASHHDCTNSANFRYDIIEKTVLEWSRKVLFDPPAENDQATQLRAEIAVITDEIERDVGRDGRLLDQLQEEDNLALAAGIRDRRLAISERIASNRRKIEKLNIALLKDWKASTFSGEDLVRHLEAVAASSSDEERFEARSKLASGLRSVIDKIEFHDDRTFHVWFGNRAMLMTFGANGDFDEVLGVRDATGSKAKAFYCRSQ